MKEKVGGAHTYAENTRSYTKLSREYGASTEKYTENLGAKIAGKAAAIAAL